MDAPTSVSWGRGPLRDTASAHNLLDKWYFNNGDTSLAESVELGAPRQLVFGVSFLQDWAHPYQLGEDS